MPKVGAARSTRKLMDEALDAAYAARLEYESAGRCGSRADAEQAQKDAWAAFGVYVERRKTHERTYLTRATNRRANGC
ncbi:hypothetical protein [Longimicrobium sp.]|jgi:hypothetical protein|uniref:hypothetical protein n=1 Tax=Longimicrobium sp. TaxID=2029185 RepID=UPI002F949845